MTRVHIVSSAPVETIETDCLIVIVFTAGLEQVSKNFPANCRGLVQQVISDEDFKAKLGERIVIARPPDMDAKRLVLWGMGECEINSPSSVLSAVQKLFRAVAKPTINHCDIVISGQASLGGVSAFVSKLIRSFYRAAYDFSEYKTETKPAPKRQLTIHSSHYRNLQKTLTFEHKLNAGIRVTKDLANMPANICTPDYLVQQALELDSEFDSISTTIVQQEEMESLGMGAYLAVNQASSFSASMPVIHYLGKQPAAATKQRHPIVLIGKGVTFDTGGISIKRAAGMHHMIYDMGGAACVLGVMRTIAELALPVDVIGILATAENSVDGSAYRPGDILTTLSGQTVEVISTDAEGRLLLCDALTYAQQFSPKAIIDIATLTGAAITTLGHQCSGMMTNDQALGKALIHAGKTSGDRVWMMPMWPDYQEALASTSADMTNAGSGSPGMITAGCFLSRYVGNTPWAHLDVAGTAFRYGKQNTATARPLPLLVQYLCTLGQRKSS